MKTRILKVSTGYIPQVKKWFSWYGVDKNLILRGGAFDCNLNCTYEEKDSAEDKLNDYVCIST